MRQQHLPLSRHPSHLHFPPATISPGADCPFPSPVFKYNGSPRSYSYLAKLLLPIYEKLWYTLPFLVTSLHVFISPYTKVEETPALHAVHDILAHGISSNALQHYDHIVYPGPVYLYNTPSSDRFLPSRFDALVQLIQPILSITNDIAVVPHTLNDSISYTLLCWADVAQLHGAAFRAIWDIIDYPSFETFKRLSVFQALSGGVYGGIIGIAMTSIIDVKFLSPNSYACDWWPELSSALFNIMHGKSKDWGVMPWWYYLSALSKLCLASIPLALLGFCISLRQNELDREMLKVLIGSVTGLVVTLSMVAHK
ncbi:hypothetical protein I312_105362 [Cryptococcus bacillisporus CA1280]|uniref:uncharacterized protein n=1 Tax=Cryptococcus bacillisporus CA1280 TaxID=1296109 RepID=UPI003367D088